MGWWGLWICGAFLLGIIAGSITMNMSLKGHAEQQAYIRASILLRERMDELVAYIEDMYHEGRAEEAFRKIKQAKEGHDGTY